MSRGSHVSLNRSGPTLSAVVHCEIDSVPPQIHIPHERDPAVQSQSQPLAQSGFSVSYASLYLPGPTSIMPSRGSVDSLRRYRN
jgi:hypothetical protein